MRDLTAEELALAPEWATNYAVDGDGDILFFDDSKNRVQLIDGTDEFSIGDYRYVKRISLQAKKIKKPFDITQHEWSDVIAEIEPESGHTLVIKSHGSWLSFDKDDVIAMARDRCVTAEDLG